MRRENAFCKLHTFSGFVYHVSCLPCFETKNGIRCIDAPKHAFIHTEIYPNLKSISESFKMYIKSRFFYMIESRATRHSAVSAFTETVEFLERSLASMLMRYCCSMIGWVFLFVFFFYFASCFEINVFYFTNLDK